MAENQPKSSLNKILIILLGTLTFLCIAMTASLFLLIKTQPQEQAAAASVSEVVAPNAAKEVKAEVVHAEGAKSEKEAPANPKPQFYKLKPAIVVNVPAIDKTRYLQVDVELMARKGTSVETIEAYGPLIRNDLITLFSNEKYEDIATAEGKEQLRKKALEAVQRIMKKNTGDVGVDQVLFTNFVSQ
ncbi:MAG: hypothetical protein BGO43_11095 [Gammaproteobacteria bacterium 39-13]|nr:flagellar basal body-associated FliL family protein [Gammaproteobacteria bacterium]OJV86583.1 MAG: hypothetical protein BGO43_11095 [Gammaproteobacteria bacterium 39-13]